MIKKITVIILIIVLSNCVVAQGVENDSDNFSSSHYNLENDYDPELYGSFLNNTYKNCHLLPLDYSGDDYEPIAKKIELDIHEEKTISLFVARIPRYSTFSDKNNTYMDFEIKLLLLNKDDWNPEKSNWDPTIHPVMSMSESDIGRKYEEDIKFDDHWFNDKLIDKTDNMYEIENNTIQFSENKVIKKKFDKDLPFSNWTGVEKNISIKIHQSGYWSLSTLVRPEGGKYWFLAEGKNITIRVDKTDKLWLKSLPVLVPGLIVGGAGICTYNTIKRKHWIDNFLSK